MGVLVLHCLCATAGADMSEKVRECLRKFDVNDDDQLDIAEVRCER